MRILEMPPPERMPDKEKMAFVIDNYAKYRRDEIISKEYIVVLPIHTRQEQIYDLNVFRFYGFECCTYIFNSSF